MSISLPRFGKFSAIIVLNILSAHLFISFPFEIPKLCMLFSLFVSHKFSKLHIFLFSFLVLLFVCLLL